MTKRKKKRISEKMRRYNLSLQRPQEEFRRRVIEWERMRKEREPEERRKERRRKWKKWLGLADFTEYDGPFPIFICAVFFLVIFLRLFLTSDKMYFRRIVTLWDNHLFINRFANSHDSKRHEFRR